METPVSSAIAASRNWYDRCSMTQTRPPLLVLDKLHKRYRHGLIRRRTTFSLAVDMKVLALVQDTDPALASAIVGSREAIWGILSDPVKFATI